MQVLKGGKGGGTTFKTAPDNLRSQDTFEGVLGLAIGPLKGPKNGLKSIKLDGTAIENATGESNFGEGFIALMGDGDPAKFPQIVQLKLGAGATPLNIGVSLTNPPPATAPGPWVTRTVNNTNADFIDLRFIAQQLYSQTKSGVDNATATIEIQMKPVGLTTWVNPMLNGTQPTYQQRFVINGGLVGEMMAMVSESFFDSNYGGPANPYYSITGKTTSPAVYEVRISVPNQDAYANTGWDIRARLIERDTYDADPNFEKRTITWESAAAVYSDTMGDHEDWRGVAWLQLYGKATDQLTGVPTVTGEYDTKIVSVPSNFNAVTRAYTGTWDGSWAKQFTNDPAWVINDAISDSLAGLSLLAPGSYLNKWDALELSKFCSVQVPDGAGGTHPRYSLNLAITDQQKAEDFIRYLAGAVGALTWDQGDGEWRLKIDQVDTPVDIFTLDNIEDEFVYSNTDIDTRYNDIIGQYKNAEMDYRQDSVRLYDSVSIAKIGHKPTTLALVGCTNRQEALRRVELRLRATVNENKLVNFTTNRRARNLEPLDLILVADGDLGDQAKRTTGRVLTISTDRKTITVRDPMRLETGVAYTLRFATPNAAYNPDTGTQPTSVDWKKPTIVATRNVTNVAPGGGLNTTTLTLDAALPTDVSEYLSVALEATALPTLPLMYRVTNLVPSDDGERVAVSALIVDTGKQDASDNVTNSATVFQDLRGPVPVPLMGPSGTLLFLLATPAEQGKNVSLVANWERPAGAFVSGFRVRYRVNGGEWKVATERTAYTSFDFHNPVPGAYEVEITTLDRRGGFSLPLVGSLAVTQELIDATDITYSDGTPIDDLQPSESGANVGSQVGVDLKDQSGVVIPSDSTIKNGAITITPGGQLNGAGGGTVTLPGLGFTGDAGASAGDNLWLNGTAVTGSANAWWGNAARTTGTASGDPSTYARATTTGQGGQANAGSPMFFNATEKAYISAVARSDGTGNSWTFSFDFRNAANTSVGTQTATITPTSSTWSLYKTAVTAPTNAAFAFVSIAATRGTGSYTDIANIRVARTEFQATNGAQGGVNFVDNSGVVQNDSQFKNSAVTISSGGTLSGAGGGTVTYSGLGGGAVGLQTDLRLGGLYMRDSVGSVLGDTTVKNSAVTISSGGVLSGAGGGTVTYSGLGGGVVGQQADLRLGGAYLKDSVGSPLGDATVKNSAVTISSGGVLSGAGGGTVTYSGLGGGVVGQQSDLRLGGSYLKDSAGATLGDATVKNSAVTISSGGVLSGAGGGTVTIGGLGYSGDLKATYADNALINSLLLIDASTWTLGNCTRVAGGTTDPLGFYFLVNTAGVDASATSAVATVPTGLSFYYSAQVKPGYSGQVAILTINWLTSTSGFISASTTNFTTSGTSWQQIEELVTKPANASQYTAGVVMVGGAAAARFGGFRFANTQTAATYGAQAGTNLLDSAGAGLADATIKNSAVSISSGGVLTGAGGGTVTFGGLGGGAVGLQSDLRLGGSYLKDSVGGTLGDTTVKNSAVTISSGGVLSGAGGGTVTYSGLGGGNVGLQSDLRLGGAYLKDSAGSTLGDATVKNSAVTISAGGVLSGAGGGTVTAPGLGVAAGATADSAPVSIGTSVPTITGNSITRTSGGSDFNCCVVLPPLKGSGRVTVERAASGETLLALDDDATTTAFASQTYACDSVGTSGQMALGGVLQGVISTGTNIGDLTLEYTGDRIRMLNSAGVVTGSEILVPSGLTLYPKVWAYEAGKTVNKIRSGPASAGAEPGADITRTLTPAAGQSILYDYSGTTSAQLPKILTNKMSAGTADVTPSTSFSYTATGCTVDTTGCLTGQVRLTAVSSSNAQIAVTATYLGVPRTEYITITRQLGTNPSGAGSGGSTAAGFTVDVSASITDTTYDGSPQPLNTAQQMVSNASGQIRLTLNAEYQATGNHSASITAKAQKSTDGTTWTDAGLSATGTSSTGAYWVDTNGNGQIDFDDTFVDGTAGTITANSLVSGFTASTAYWIRWIAFKGGTDTSVGVSGTASGAQS